MWSIKFDNSIFQYWSVYSRYATLKDVLCAWSNHFKKENGKRKKGENYVIFYKIEHLYYD